MSPPRAESESRGGIEEGAGPKKEKSGRASQDEVEEEEEEGGPFFRGSAGETYWAEKVRKGEVEPRRSFSRISG